MTPYATVSFSATYRLKMPPPPKPKGALKGETVEAACRLVGISVDDCVGTCRRSEIVRKRWQVMALLHAWGLPMAEIGRRLGKDHTTVVHAMQRLKEEAAR